MSAERAPDARRRLRLLFWGANAALTPMFVLFLASLFLGRGMNTFPEYVLLPALLLLTLLPVNLAYVIVVQRAMAVGVAIRSGLQHALATRAVDLLRIGLSVAVIVISFDLLRGGERGLGRWLLVGVLAGLTLAVQNAARRLRGWLDRRFFREAVNTEHLLEQLSEEVLTIVEPAALLETVSERIAQSLHVPRVAVLLARNGEFAPAHLRGFGSAPEAARLNRGGAIIGGLRAAREPLHVYFDDPANWVNQDSVAPPEREALRELSAQLLLPVAAKQELLGVLCLGAKQSEEPYSRGDLRLLKSVASQTALALHNAQLAQAVAEEQARRELLNRELEIAREVQERLLPQRGPRIAGLEYAARCRPAASVGGDSYDFFETPDGQLALAIGDVSGKGIPAALLMASLQAALRGLVSGGVRDLAELLRLLNRLVFDASPRNRFATLFFALYEPAARRLRFASAGHGEALLLRAGGAVERLAARGIGLGLRREASYVHAEVLLAPGDLLVASTDGIAEARNGAGEEFGEARLAEALPALAGLTPAEAIDRLIALVDEFATGAPQHDDITLLVARVG
jgi:sigma-B regulation protein RsbU (phosphoserine phosphatase)